MASRRVRNLFMLKVVVMHEFTDLQLSSMVNQFQTF